MASINIPKLTLTILMVFVSTFGFCQEANKDVTITASGSGATLEDAKQSALRSATEQAFGAFISSKMEIFNDQVVADQMSSVSSGNIKSYEVLNEDQLPDGRYGVTLKAIVSVDKLTSFVQAKGVEIEIKGGLFALNIKQQMLNEEGEVEAVYAMVGLLHEPMQTAFDYTMKSGDPKSLDAQNQNWEIPLEVTATCNKNMDFCANYLIKTLRALSLTAEEVASYKALNKKVFPVNVSYAGKSEVFNLRTDRSLALISALGSNWEFYTRLFTVQSGMDESNGNGKSRIHDFSRSRNYNNDDKTINFLTTGQQAATFSWQDKRSLSQIEQMTGYKVKPRGVVSQFKLGGYVVSENGGHGVVMALIDLGKFNWVEGKLACKEWNMNGYDDWQLPAIHELENVYNNWYKLGLSCGLLQNADYWSSSEYYGHESYKGYMCFLNFGKGLNDYSASRQDGEMMVRPFRTF
jgi:hypothetical protein